MIDAAICLIAITCVSLIHFCVFETPCGLLLQWKVEECFGLVFVSRCRVTRENEAYKAKDLVDSIFRDPKIFQVHPSDSRKCLIQLFRNCTFFRIATIDEIVKRHDSNIGGLSHDNGV